MLVGFVVSRLAVRHLDRGRIRTIAVVTSSAVVLIVRELLRMPAG